MGRKKSSSEQLSAFAQRLAMLRKQAAMTMTALGEQAGVTPSYISLLESGERQPSREIVIRLAQILFGPNNANGTDELLLLAGLSPTQPEKPQVQDLTTIYQVHLAASPDDFKVYAALIRVLLRNHDLKKAQEMIHQGMQRFDNSYQMQALLAQLELSRGHFLGALNAQKAALELYQAEYTAEQLSKDSNYADLYTNLGVICFLWGMEFFQAKVQAKVQAEVQAEMQAARNQALKLFQEAQAHFQTALQIAPQDIYLLDEYARISFNIADLSEPDQQPALWQEVIDNFARIIRAEDNGALGIDSIREAQAFLAYSYAKAGQFEQAELLTCMVRASFPSYGLIHYVMACMYNLKYVECQETTYLALALSCLQRVMALPDAQGYAEDALTDPDLRWLREYLPKEFEQVVGTI